MILGSQCYIKSGIALNGRYMEGRLIGRVATHGRKGQFEARRRNDALDPLRPVANGGSTAASSLGNMKPGFERTDPKLCRAAIAIGAVTMRGR